MRFYWASDGAVGVLWTASLLLPVLAECRDGVPVSWWAGIEILLVGWIGIILGKIGWYANIPLLIGTVLLAFGRVRLWLAVLALFLAGTAFGRLELSRQPELSGGPVCQRGPGFWLWFASFVVLLVAEAWGRLVRNEHDPVLVSRSG